MSASITVSVLRSTPAALLVVDNDGTEAWIPRSQIVDSYEVGTVAGAKLEIIIPAWLARSRGLAWSRTEAA